jgi:hypothetical protein
MLSVVLIIVGTGLYLFSIGVAFGWDRGPLSVIGTIIAILGLGLLFGGYWASRNSEGAPLAALCLKLALAFGSTFLVFGLLAAFFGRGLYLPIGYFIGIGSLSVLGFVKFRAYTNSH